MAEPSAAPEGIEVVDVPMLAWVGSRDHALPLTLNSFGESPERLTKFRQLSEALRDFDWAKAVPIAKSLSYQLVAIQDAGQWYVVASDDSRTGRGPVVVLNINPRADIILEAPHMPFEVGTGEQAVLLMRDLGGRAAVIAGAHRCASRAFAKCSGKTTVCGISEGYRDSDVGHNTETLINEAHKVFAETWGKSLVVSLHGMREDPGGPAIIISNGIHGEDLSDPTPATKLRMIMGPKTERDGSVVSCNYHEDQSRQFRRLCGYTNVQGRDVNGSGDACLESVDSGTGRFIHLEQGWGVLKSYANGWSHIYESTWPKTLLDAFAQVIPQIKN